MIKLIRQLLQKFADDIDSGNCEMSSEEQFKLISILSSLADKDQRSKWITEYKDIWVMFDFI